MKLFESKQLSSVEAKDRENKKEGEGSPESILERRREAFLKIMEGRDSLENYTIINPYELIPQSAKFVSGIGDFELRPGSWWRTEAYERKKVMYYPRSFAFIEKGLKEKDPEQYEKTLEIMRGGMLHEFGHHDPAIQTFQMFMMEYDTNFSLITKDGIDENTAKGFKQALQEQWMEDPGTRSVLRTRKTYNVLGKYIENTLFFQDLWNVVGDIALEAKHKKHIDNHFANDAKKTIDALNRAIFYEGQNPHMPMKGRLSYATQLKNALIIRKAKVPEDKEWGESGFDVWLNEGFVDDIVREKLNDIKGAFRVLTEDIADIYYETNVYGRMKFVQQKLMKAYLKIREAYVDLVKKDIQRAVEEYMQKQQGGEEQQNGEGKGKGEEQKEGQNQQQEQGQNQGQGEGQPEQGQEQKQGQRGQGQEGGSAEQKEGKGSEAGMPSSGGVLQKGKEGGKEIKYEDLPPKIREKIINDLLDRYERERVSHDDIEKDPKSPKDKDPLNDLREGLSDAVNPKPEISGEPDESDEKGRGGNEAELKEKENGGEGPKEDLGEEEFSLLDKRSAGVARRRRERQRHRAREMEEAEMLGLDLVRLKEYKEAKDRISSAIHLMSDIIGEAIRKKIEMFVSDKEPEGRLQPWRMGDFFTEIREGNEEPRVFEKEYFENVLPRIDILFMLDHSGSMSDNAAAMGRTTLAVLEGVSAAVEREKERILSEVEDVSSADKNLFRAAMITFSDSPFMRLSFKDYNENEKEKLHARMYFTAKNIEGGSTADAQALRKLIEYLKKSKETKTNLETITLVIVVSDGQGEKDTLKKIFKESEELPHTLFLAIGAGDGTEGVVDAWKQLKGAPIKTMMIKDKEIDKMPFKAASQIADMLSEEIKEL